jgi:very-short-patch-repair endonuclease
MFIRTCPKCSKEIQYKSISRFSSAIKTGKLCLSCACFSRTTDEYRHKCSESAKKRHKENPQIRQPMKQSTKQKISYALTGKPKSAEHIEKMRKANLGRIPSNKGIPASKSMKEKLSKSLTGRQLTPEHKNNIRLGRINVMKNNPGATVSKTETKFLDSLETLYDIHIERSFIIENRVFDGRYKNILIECDGSYWHSFAKAKQNDNHKDTIAIVNGYTLFRVKLDKIKEIDTVIAMHRKEFDNCFIPQKCILQVSYPT